LDGTPGVPLRCLVCGNRVLHCSISRAVDRPFLLAFQIADRLQSLPFAVLDEGGPIIRRLPPRLQQRCAPGEVKWARHGNRGRDKPWHAFIDQGGNFGMDDWYKIPQQAGIGSIGPFAQALFVDNGRELIG
jgi:hypothetical protein